MSPLIYRPYIYRIEKSKHFKKVNRSKIKKASSILRVGFALSKYPYFNRAHVVSSGFGCLYLYVKMIQVLFLIKWVNCPIPIIFWNRFFKSFVIQQLFTFVLLFCSCILFSQTDLIARYTTVKLLKRSNFYSENDRCWGNNLIPSSNTK